MGWEGWESQTSPRDFAEDPQDHRLIKVRKELQDPRIQPGTHPHLVTRRGHRRNSCRNDWAIFIYSINFHVEGALSEVLTPLQSSRGDAGAATRPRPLCKVCSPGWDTLEAVPKTFLRMDFREKSGYARNLAIAEGISAPAALSSHIWRDQPQTAEALPPPRCTLPFFWSNPPQISRLGFLPCSLWRNEASKLLCGFPAPLGGRDHRKKAASIKHLGLISLFTTGWLGATFVAREVIWCPLEMLPCSTKWLPGIPPLIPLGLCIPLAARRLREKKAVLT